MKLLMLSRDAKIFEKGSAVRARMVEYGTLFEELHIIVFTKCKAQSEKRKTTIAKNVWAYPTNSRTIFFYAFDAMSIAKKILATSYKLQATSWIVTSQDPFETGYVASRIAKKLQVPLQIQIHTDFLSPHFRKESIKNFIRYIVSKIIIPKADCIRVVSEKIKNSLQATSYKLQAKTIVFPIFIDTEKIKNARSVALPKKYDFTVLWVGRLEREKNCSLAIDAFAEFIKKIPNAGLIIVGNGTERKKLELQATSYKLQANIIFEGWKDDVTSYYKSADVLLTTSWYEGYGLNMVEARIADIPVVAPDVGVAREVGAYITEHTANSIAETLIQLHDGKLPKRDNYEYPYKDKNEYLELYKKSFEQCLIK